ncbi:hypothetical protein ACM01_39660 [Streptomyces viridochromogenes]|uniref:Uncharacterized protein n=2 Tax=Streptomyces viridochromogenes TaxID=1938 RepID=A0A0J7YYV2_STRVR|nr:hypothetical protein ACM01_39660 [Streptomyces viridochromogenes]KOG08775.1 hypothetical protein ADK35_40960 [Streptomyces viridochromogenes]KOG09117.1 hypothetical protein ADK36_41695 [Streptomyces viridochromogenes]
MRVRQTSGRCPRLRLLDREPGAEVRAFEPVLRLLEKRVAPHMEVLRPGLIAAPAREPARPFGGEQALVEHIGLRDLETADAVDAIQASAGERHYR